MAIPKIKRNRKNINKTKNIAFSNYITFLKSEALPKKVVKENLPVDFNLNILDLWESTVIFL
jgi:hypothetical protein